MFGFLRKFRKNNKSNNAVDAATSGYIEQQDAMPQESGNANYS